METTIIMIVMVIGAFILGGAYGWNLRERIAQRIVDKAMEQVKVHRAELIPIVVEKHKDCLFVYNKENHEFMAQGSSMEELNTALESRFPGKKFSCSEEHLAMIKEL